MKKVRRWILISLAILIATISFVQAQDTAKYMAAAEKWVDSEFNPSTLSREEQLAELKWFIEAAAPFRGMDIKVVSETLTTHKYESQVLAKAFSEITGINIIHDLIA